MSLIRICRIVMAGRTCAFRLSEAPYLLRADKITTKTIHIVRLFVLIVIKPIF